MAFKERRLWYFQCKGCGKKRRQSHKKKIAREALCKLCRKKNAATQYPGLFDAPVVHIDENMPVGVIKIKMDI